VRWSIVVAMIVGMVGSAPALAVEPGANDSVADHVTLTLSDRVRGEFVDWFRPPPGTAPAGAQRYDFFANQLRFGLRVTYPHIQLVAEGQDTRLVNLPGDASLKPPQGNLGPGAIYFANTHDRDQGETFIKQGYVAFTDIPGAAGLTMTLGRFEYSDGLETIPADPALAWLKRARIGERLVGPFGYTHVTRSFDGVRAAYNQPSWNVTAFGTRPTMGGFEVSANRELDVTLAGVAATLKKIADLPPADVRLFYLYYDDGRDEALKVDNRPRDVRLADHKDLRIHTWGGHALVVADAGPGKLDGLLWSALQVGDWGELTHFAWAVAVEGGYQLPDVPTAPWLRIGYDRSSGDGDPNDNQHHTFFQLLPTARLYAQTPFYNLMNSEDFFAQLILKPHQRLSVRADYHWLRLSDAHDLWYSGGGATNNHFFGFAGIPSGGNHELAHVAELALTVTLLEQLTAYVYYGHTFGQDVVQNTFAGGSANYGYVEMTYRY